MYYDQDRLKTPLIRTEERGKQVFREASWDEALEIIAVKMKDIAEVHGPECFAQLTHGSGGKYFGNLIKAFGSSSIAVPSYAQCRKPREVAYHMTYGEGVGSPNEEITKYNFRKGAGITQDRTAAPEKEGSGRVLRSCYIIQFLQSYSGL